MRKLLFVLVVLAGAAGMCARAQEPAGTWQGTLEANGKPLRLVLQVTKDGPALKGKFFSIDQGGQGITTGPVTVQAQTFSFAIPAFEITYEGKLSADGKTAIGTWKQGGNPLPLTLQHVTPEVAWAIPKPQEQLPPMAADVDPSFDVATIKPSKPDQQGKAITVRGRRLVTINTSLTDLISFSYELHTKQVTGLPPWAAADKFDIEAQPDVPGMPNDKQLKSMVRKLLAERFKLTFHHEQKELSVYTLGVGKTGPKLEKSEADAGSLPGLGMRALGKMIARNATMADFAHWLQYVVLDRPVVNQTALSGRFNFAMNWTPDESQFGGMGLKVPPPSDAADAPPSLYTAMQEQLGLKLEPTKSSVDVLVVDKVDKPSEN